MADTDRYITVKVFHKDSSAVYSESVPFNKDTLAKDADAVVDRSGFGRRCWYEVEAMDFDPTPEEEEVIDEIND